MTARPATPDYGRLTVMLQAQFRLTRLFVVPAGAFRPVPGVDSAVVRLVPLGAAKPRIADAALFARVVAAAFGQRRKTLRNALATMCDEGVASPRRDRSRRTRRDAVDRGFRAARERTGGRSARLTMPMPAADGIRVHRNPRAAPATEPYGTRAFRDPESRGLRRRRAGDPSLARVRRNAAAPPAGSRGATGCRRPSLQGRGRPLRPQELQGAGRRLRRVPVAEAGDRSAHTPRSGRRLARPDRGPVALHHAGRHRHLRHRRQPRTLRRLGRATLRLPLRDLRARVRERGAMRRHRALRRRRRARAGQLRRLRAPCRGRGAQERLDRGVGHDLRGLPRDSDRRDARLRRDVVRDRADDGGRAADARARAGRRRRAGGVGVRGVLARVGGASSTARRSSSRSRPIAISGARSPADRSRSPAPSTR